MAGRAFERIINDCVALIRGADSVHPHDLAILIRDTAKVSAEDFVAVRVHWTILNFLAQEEKHRFGDSLDAEKLECRSFDVTEVLAMVQVLGRLPRHDVEFLVEACQDLSLELTAARLKSTPAAVRQRVCRLRGRLRKVVGE
ncbi:MAG TPA: hypothetical protein VG937_04490 [Polyangiaceae bacterium]|nr:hypothetical protein [Polyangiaceae bacterium]